MSGNYFDPDWTSKVTMPVKRVGDRWEFFYGGDVPVKEGTLAELTLSADQITDERFRQRVTQELAVKILDEGTRLLVALSDRSHGGNRVGKWPQPFPLNVPPGTTRWECITLGPCKIKSGQQERERGGLWLKLKGLERCELSGSTVQMPTGFGEPTATSLNHALTLLSQTYEKHRISNTGNVYTRVFYQDMDECWYHLDDLRNGVIAQAERKVLNDLWAELEEKLGWRPVAVQKRGRR